LNNEVVLTMPKLKYDGDKFIEYKIGDCLDLMREMDDNSVDLVLTDPPYDVDYADWDTLRLEWLKEAQRISAEVIFTPGIRNIHKYPSPKWVICWAKPGSTSRNDTGGFNHWDPLFYYGDKKIMVDFIYLPACVNHSDVSGHPCPKPINLYTQIINKMTDVGDLVCDPFLGSGTTLKACQLTGRNGIGFEISKEYESVIRKRCSIAKSKSGNLYIRGTRKLC